MLAERSLPPEAWCGVIGALELGLNIAVAESTGKHPLLEHLVNCQDFLWMLLWALGCLWV